MKSFNYFILLLFFCTLSLQQARAEWASDPNNNAERFRSEDSDSFTRCIDDAIEGAGEETTVGSIRKACIEAQEDVKLPDRLLKEQATQDNSFVITPHRQNYLLPFTYMENPNQKPFLQQNFFPGEQEPLHNYEAKLQLSIKIPLSYGDLLVGNDGLYFGFTLKSFWQVFNQGVSRPFRENNYRPEIFYQAPIKSRLLGGTWFGRIGMEHESNGRAQYLSRSWNRVYLSIGFQRENWALLFTPWYRLPDKEKIDDGDSGTPPLANGDDNPDIQKYMGYHELTTVFQRENWDFTTLTRYNFSTNRGAVQLDMSFPLWGRLKGYVQYFGGYGESLVDYNHLTQRFGVGVLLTDLL